MSSTLLQQPVVALPGHPSRTVNGVRIAVAVVAASVLVAVCAHVSLALPFTPVPVVLSDMAVLLVGFLLGPRAGAAAMLLYLAEGAAGAPVFNPHGPGGIAQLFGATGGFLLSYPFVAFVSGWVYDALRTRLHRPVAAFLAALSASVPLFFAGAAWLALLLHGSLPLAVRLAVTPFLGIALVKMVVAAALVSSLHQLRAPKAA